MVQLKSKEASINGWEHFHGRMQASADAVSVLDLEFSVLFYGLLGFGVVLQQLHHVMEPVTQFGGAAMLIECVQSIGGGDPCTTNISQQVRVCGLEQDDLGVISVEVYLRTAKKIVLIK